MIRYKIGSFFGVPIYIASSWFYFVIFICLFSFVLTSGSVFYKAVYSACVFLILNMVYTFVVLHEFGHIYVAKLFGHKCRDISIWPLGGLASIQIPIKNPKAHFWVALGGPLVSLALCAIGFVMRSIIPSEHVLESLAGLIFKINGLLFIFNMLPVYPMDGGRIVHSLLTWWYGDYLEALDKVCVLTIAIAIPGSVLFFYFGYIGAALIMVAMCFLSKIEARMHMAEAESKGTIEKEAWRCFLE